MITEVIDVKKIAKSIREELSTKISSLKTTKGIIPGLAIVIAGDDPASLSYVNNQKKLCEKEGINCYIYHLPYETKECELIELINKLNNSEEVHGIIAQVPFPKHINEDSIAKIISIKKDVDCFNPENMGRMFRGDKCFLPCTPKGIIRILKESNISIEGKNAVVVGRSNIVGKPAAMLLLRENASVDICHSRTKNLKDHLLRADIIVSAVGKPGLINGDMIKEGAVIIDAGTTMVNGVLTGDVAMQSVINIASYVTPVPGGVGSMTTTMLLENVVEAALYE